jgi:hypothetical protein
MAITTYAELCAAAANWLVRDDLSPRIPEFVTLAEARLNRVLRARLAETEAALMLGVGARTLALPTGFAEPLRLWLVRPEGREALRLVEPSLLGAVSLRGEPAAWAVDGGAIAFDRPADRTYDLVLRMRSKVRLSDAAPTNAILAEAPDVYLFATLCEAAPYLRDGELAASYELRLERAIDELNLLDARSRSGVTLSTELAQVLAASC